MAVSDCVRPWTLAFCAKLARYPALPRYLFPSRAAARLRWQCADYSVVTRKGLRRLVLWAPYPIVSSSKRGCGQRRPRRSVRMQYNSQCATRRRCPSCLRPALLGACALSFCTRAASRFAPSLAADRLETAATRCFYREPRRHTGYGMKMLQAERKRGGTIERLTQGRLLAGRPSAKRK